MTAARLTALALFLASCGVEPHGRDTGGVDETRGLAVVSSNYGETTVSLLSTAGEMLSESFISSRSEKPGLSTALTGDVVLPTSVVPGGELVLIDRLNASVLTWVNLETAAVRAQLSVTTGFLSNPQDYVPHSSTEAFVTRYEPNLAAGREPFDGGNDVLVIDPSVPEITGRIDLMPAMSGAPPGYYPRASGALMARGVLFVFCEGMSLDWRHTDSRVLAIDPTTRAIQAVLTIPALRGCARGALSPDAGRLAVVCTGSYVSDPANGFSDSGIVLVDLADVPTVSTQLSSKDLGIGQLGGAEWTSDGSLLLTTTGRLEDDSKGAVHLLAVAQAELSAPLVETDRDPFAFGPPRCTLPEPRCYVPDAEARVLHEISLVEDGTASVTRLVSVDRSVGLPPRALGLF